MTTSLSQLTPGEFLGAAGTPSALSDALSTAGTLDEGKLRFAAALGPIWQSVVDEVGSALSSVLDLDLGLIAIDAWNVAEEVRASRRRTLPRGREVVDLPQTSISLDRTPVIEIGISGGPPLLRVPFELSVDLDAPELAVSVVDGRVTGVQTGQCSLTVILRWAGQTLARRKGVIVPSQVFAKDSDADQSQWATAATR